MYHLGRCSRFADTVKLPERALTDIGYLEDSLGGRRRRVSEWRGCWTRSPWLRVEGLLLLVRQGKVR